MHGKITEPVVPLVGGFQMWSIPLEPALLRTEVFPGDRPPGLTMSLMLLLSRNSSIPVGLMFFSLMGMWSWCPESRSLPSFISLPAQPSGGGSKRRESRCFFRHLVALKRTGFHDGRNGHHAGNAVLLCRRQMAEYSSGQPKPGRREVSSCLHDAVDCK